MTKKQAILISSRKGTGDQYRIVPPSRLSYLGFVCDLLEVNNQGSVKFRDLKGRWWARAEYQGMLLKPALEAQGFLLTSEDQIQRDTKQEMQNLLVDLEEDMDEWDL